MSSAEGNNHEIQEKIAPLLGGLVCASGRNHRHKEAREEEAEQGNGLTYDKFQHANRSRLSRSR